MFKTRTAFIVGAGASREYGFPLGLELARTIRLKTRVEFDSIGRLQGEGDKALIQAVQTKLGCTMADALAAAGRLSKGLPLRNSIDDFLDIHHDDKVLVALGKAATTKAILEAELNSPMSFRRTQGADSTDFSQIEGSWLVRFLRMLGPAGPDSMLQGSVLFVVFNYDRAIEFGLMQGLQALYGYNEARAADVVRGIKIFHPYGTVGSTEPDTVNREFGIKQNDTQCVERSNSIRTYTEEVASMALSGLHTALKEVQRLIFLGFGFHAQNLQLLRPADGLPSMQIIATSLGVPDQERGVVATRMNRLYGSGGGGASLNNVTCAGLFDTFHFRFSEM